MSNRGTLSIERIHSTRLLPLFNYADLAFCMEVIRVAYAAGLRAFELTDRDPSALDVFREIAPICRQLYPDLSLGAGTITLKEKAEAYISAGADFIIAPNMDPVIGAICATNSIPWIPGCMTPTEILAARAHGAEIVKLFPAETLGVAYVRHLYGPIPGVQLIVTGGIGSTPELIQPWLDAGVFAVGLGSQLFGKALQKSRDFYALQGRLEMLVQHARLQDKS